MTKDKIVDWLEKRVNDKIVFDNCPGNEDGWYEVSRYEIVKIVDGIIPMVNELMNQKHREKMTNNNH